MTEIIVAAICLDWEHWAVLWEAYSGIKSKMTNYRILAAWKTRLRSTIILPEECLLLKNK